jgi:HEAT repeat protein
MSDVLKAFLDSVTAGDDTLAETAALALSHEDDAVVPALCDLLADADPDRRWWAARALAAIGTKTVAEHLVAASTDPDPSVRACAAQGLGEQRSEGAIAALMRCLADASPLVSRIAADSLARVGAPAVPALIAALQGGETPVRAGAARALSIILPEEAIQALCAALDDPSAIVTYYAEEALERLGVGLIFFRP